MLNPPVEREQELGGGLDSAERTPRCEAELDEVDVAALREVDLELGREMQQHRAQRFELTPLRVRVARLGKLSHLAERLAQRIVAAQARDQALAAFARRAMLLAKALPLRQLPAPLPLLDQKEDAPRPATPAESHARAAWAPRS